MDSAAEKCFSNLLAVGFRRFEVDVYWDVTRHIFSLCPVQLGNTTSNTAPTTSQNTSVISTTGQSTAGAQHFFPRQESQTVRSLTVASTEADLDDTTLAALPTPLTTSTLSSGMYMVDTRLHETRRVGLCAPHVRSPCLAVAAESVAEPIEFFRLHSYREVVTDIEY